MLTNLDYKKNLIYKLNYKQKGTKICLNFKTYFYQRTVRTYTKLWNSPRPKPVNCDLQNCRRIHMLSIFSTNSSARLICSSKPSSVCVFSASFFITSSVIRSTLNCFFSTSSISLSFSSQKSWGVFVKFLKYYFFC